MAFTIHDIGYNYIESTEFKIIRPSGSSNYLFLFFLSEIYMKLNGAQVTLPPYSCIIFAPNYPQIYYNDQSGFTNDWFHFIGDDTKTFLQELHLPLNTPFSLTNYSFIRPFIESLEQEYLRKELFWQEHLHSLLTSFFIQLAREHIRYTAYHINPTQTDLLEKFRLARVEILTHLEYPWTIYTMAKLTQLSDSRFSVLYKSFFGMSPKEDLIHERIKKAQYLLSTNTLSVSEVAYRVGYENIYHFNRQFKKIVGVPPGKWRT